MTVFLGVDGGGTKTEFVCIDETGRVIARALTGTTYHLQVGLPEVMRRLEHGTGTVCGQLGISPADLGFAFFGLPAFGEDAVVDPQIVAGCGRLVGHERYRCDNDMVCGWAGSLACQDGINLVAGTGSIGYGERQGRRARVGGWGEIFSDEGSAYWIAIQGLNAFTRMCDGRLQEGALRAAFVHELQLGTDLDVCARIMGEGGMGRNEIASLARIVAQAAVEGDTVAAAILKLAGKELGSMAEALRKTLAFAENEDVLVSWSGGIMAHQQRVRDAFIESVSSRGKYTVIEPRYGAAMGAALYAAKLAQP